jgi:nucleoside-diphosphate-sugar epimerase
VLLTGATGFIGAHLTSRLVNEGAHVSVLVRRALADGRLSSLEGRISAQRGDVTDLAAVRAALAESRAEVVFHLAADTGARRAELGWDGVARALRVNLDGTLTVLRAVQESSHEVAAFVRAGGLEEYGAGPIPYREGQREAPISAYSASQVAATHFCQVLQRDTAAAIITLRPALVYGPGQSDDFFIPSLIRSCLANAPFEMTSGEQGRDLLYVDDVVEAFARAASRPELRGQVVNVGAGVEYAMRDVARMIVRLTGSTAPLDVGAKPARAGDIAHLLADASLARERLGWSAHVGLEEGLQRTITWYRSNGRSGERTDP